jgi:hypothetical protein
MIDRYPTDMIEDRHTGQKLSDQLTSALVSEIIPSQTAIPLNGLTIGNFYMPLTFVSLGTITLG